MTNKFFDKEEMSKFEPNKSHLREVLLFHFNIKKSAAETHRILVEAYGDSAPSKTTCKEWFRRFKSGDFSVVDLDHPGPRKRYDNAELQALLDQDPCQTQKQLAESLNVVQSSISRRLKDMGKIYKQGKWVPYELKPTDVENFWHGISIFFLSLVVFPNKSSQFA